jgi:hypothetical protein
MKQRSLMAFPLLNSASWMDLGGSIGPLLASVHPLNTRWFDWTPPYFSASIEHSDLAGHRSLIATSCCNIETVLDRGSHALFILLTHPLDSGGVQSARTSRHDLYDLYLHRYVRLSGEYRTKSIKKSKQTKMLEPTEFLRLDNRECLFVF